MSSSDEHPARRSPPVDGGTRIVEHLGLERHPEGGWFRRTWTSTQLLGDGPRSAGSSILYLLEADEVSHWHRIDASESWQHVAGAPLVLSRWGEGDTAVSHATLGPDLLDGQVPQCVVEASCWQSARSLGAWSLVVCLVVPEFLMDHFELAPEGWSPPV